MQRSHSEKAKYTDAKGRITLGSQHKGKQFQVVEQPDGSLFLFPVKQVPAQEAWLWQNPQVLGMVRQGITQSQQGTTKYLGSFSQFADTEIED